MFDLLEKLSEGCVIVKSTEEMASLVEYLILHGQAVKIYPYNGDYKIVKVR